jgi:3-dehydroquinate synthase
MVKIEEKTRWGQSTILIEDGLLDKAANILTKEYPESRFAIVIDSNLEKVYGAKLRKIMPNSLHLIVPASELNKNFQTVADLASKLINAGYTATDVIIGFGGGMITDLAGFLASIFMRGTHYVAIPTSLMGMVDAAIAGKTSVDLIAKNMLGTIYPARFVLIDPDFLKHFVQNNRMPGLSEVIKFAAIHDETLFKDIEAKNLNLANIIKKSVAAKVAITGKDLKESGHRKILNYGHTFGHALEGASHYLFNHDQAVAIGMVIANKIAQKLGFQKPMVGDKIKTTLEKFNLPTEFPSTLRMDDMVTWLKKDKKRKGNKIAFVVVPKLGPAKLVPMTAEELVKLAR